MPILKVRCVDGRYPYSPGTFRSENIDVSIRRHAENCFRIRLDDSAPRHSDMWLEIEIALVEEEVAQ